MGTTTKVEMRDPRHSNQLFDVSSVGRYLRGYAKTIESCLTAVEPDIIESCFEVIKQTLREGKRIYVAGNGGSAAISDHLCCDFSKGTFSPRCSALRTHSLSSNSALLSAIANDYGYDRAFSSQLELYGDQGDLLILISSSGNSENIIRALEAAQRLKIRVIGFSGFNGGLLRDRADISIHVPYHNYGIVEDCHQAIMHSLAQCLAHWQDQGSPSFKCK